MAQPISGKENKELVKAFLKHVLSFLFEDVFALLHFDIVRYGIQLAFFLL